MKSLRGRLILATAMCSALLLSAWGVWLYTSMRSALLEEFDEALQAKARALGGVIERQPEAIEFEADPQAMPEFWREHRPEYFEVWLSTGQTLIKSESLGSHSLPRGQALGSGRAVVLPDGRPGRLLAMRLLPRTEDHVHDPARQTRPPITAPLPPGADPLVTVTIARDTLDVARVLAKLQQRLILMGLAAVVFSALALALLIGRGLLPLRRLTEQLSSADERNLSRRVDLPDVPAELAPVVQRLNEFMARLDAAFERERAFTSDVAHELRTPLAGITAALEVSASRPRQPQQYQQTVLRCLAMARQMSQMVENLLALARAESDQLRSAVQDVDVASLALDCWSDVDARARQRDLQVHWEVSEASEALGDPESIRLIVRNLLENAVSYTNAAGRIWIEITAEPTGRLVFSVRNTGNSLQGPELERVFDRFWRQERARTGNDGHHGLGLPLCRRLAATMGAHLVAQAPAEGEFEVRLVLPAGIKKKPDDPESSGEQYTVADTDCERNLAAGI